MKCLILAAGYATRLYPLTKNFPKPLLKVAGKPILGWLTEDLETCGLIDEYAVISNHRFAPHFNEWAAGLPLPVTVLDDGTVSNEDRLGAVKDIRFAIDALHIDDDIVVIAGDNLLDFSLTRFVDYARGKDTACVMRYYEPDRDRLKKCGVAETGPDDLILSMEEKPAEPKSHWCCPPFYYFPKRELHLVAEGIEAGCGTDAPGSFVVWLCARTAVHAMEMPGRRYDIGDLASYEQAQKEYKGITI
ncbi:MAG: nucleotidyltransferase family protein [Abditibacteriota bacterium]|nr:nucleotidyltransferase family protein [Abditibacteriota bacterium]